MNELIKCMQSDDMSVNASYLSAGSAINDAINNVINDVTVTEIPISRIRPNPNQPRRYFDDEKINSLADSIRRYGILQPISVRQDSANHNCFEIIAGERRWRAATIAGFLSVPCIVIETSEKESAELAIIENLQREDLNIFEQAMAISSLLNIYRLTQEQAADKLSVSQSYIANKLRLLRFTPDERALILENGLTERHSRALLRCTDPAVRTRALVHIISHNYNVSATEQYIETLLTKAPSPPSRKPRGKFVIKDLRLFYNSVEHAAQLMRTSGVPVKIDREETGEQIEIRILIGGDKCFT